MTFRQEHTVLERFEAKFIPEPNCGCWIWTASLHRDGYGQLMLTISPGRKQIVKANRLSWRLYRGEVPDALDVLHTCDQRWCVNPEHLYLGTHPENMADMVRRGRASRSGPGQGIGMALTWTRLTDEAVREIRADIRLHRVIAADYGVKREYVTMIKGGRKRRHVV